MKRLALALALSGLCALTPLSPLHATEEGVEAVAAANDAAANARADMYDEFGGKLLKPGQFVWKDKGASGTPRVVISLSEQMAYVYRGNNLVAVSTVSSGKAGNDTPLGIFPILGKKVMHHSRKYDNAPMPFMQRLDNYGIALHAGRNPGYPASHGCIRLPAAFAKKLYGVTSVGTTVMIAA